LRTLPIVDLAREALETQRAPGAARAAAGVDWADTGYVFTTRTGRPVDPHNLSRSFDRIVAAAGRVLRPAAHRRDPAHVSVTLGIYGEVFDTQIYTALQHMNRALRGGGPTQCR